MPDLKIPACRRVYHDIRTNHTTLTNLTNPTIAMSFRLNDECRE
jgi:hypothetical protein